MATSKKSNVLPNLNQSVVVGKNQVKSMNAEDAQALASNARTNGTIDITVAGTVGDGDVATVTFTHALLSGGVNAYAVTAASDTATTVAAKLAALINADAELAKFGVYASNAAGVLTIKWPGPVATLNTITVGVSGGVTLTRNPTSGKFTGGAGAIIPTKSFVYMHNNAPRSYKKDFPVVVTAKELADLVRDLQPIS